MSDPVGGVIAPNVTSPENPALSVIVLTTTPLFIRLYVNGPVPPLEVTVYVTVWPWSRTVFDGVSPVRVGAALTVIVFETELNM